MKNYVTICGFPRWAILCLACLLASQVVANFTDIDSLHLEFITDSSKSIELSDDQILRILGAYDQSISLPYLRDDFSYNPIYKMSNSSMINALNVIKHHFSSPTYQNRVGNDYYATLYGLIAGWSPNSVPNVDGIPYGVETNGIFWYARDLSDSLHNTNSVFHRQLTAQETLTNQMERFLIHTSNYLERISYQLTSPYANEIDKFYLTQDGFYNSAYTNNPYYLLSSMGLNFDFSILDWDDIFNEYKEPWVYISNDYPGDTILTDYSRIRYERYGTKWGFDAITNYMNRGFSMSDIDLVKDDVDDIVQDSTDEVESSLPPKDETTDDRRPGNYEPVDDERIDTQFVSDAFGQKENFFLNKDLFNTFKSSYRSRFNSSGSNKLAYEFSFEASEDDLTVSEADIMNGVDISSHKSDINEFLRVMVGLLRFTCIVILFGKAFKMVSEVFST